MKKVFQSSLIFFILILGYSCFSQVTPKVSTGPPPPAANYPVVKKIGTTKVTYSKSRNVSIAETQNSLVYGEGLDGITFSATFTSKGKKVVKPESVTLRFYPIAKDRTYIDDRTVKIFVDKKEIINDKSTFIRANSDGRVTLAALEQKVSYETFVKISKAYIVEMQIGPAKFELDFIMLKSFRNLLKLIED